MSAPLLDAENFMREIWSQSIIASALLGMFAVNAANAATLTFQTNAPIPGATDIYNLTGAIRDGLNVSDANGLDGPLSDGFTYVARDRVNQGQTFATAANSDGYVLKAIWVQHTGYVSNGISGNTESGYNGTWWDFSSGGAFTVRVTDPASVGTANFTIATETVNLSGSESNNPGVRPNGGTTDNGTGRWLRFALSTSVLLSSNQT
jgi:hypothetical protein